MKISFLHPPFYNWKKSQTNLNQIWFKNPAELRLLNTTFQPGVNFYGYVIHTWKTAGAIVIYSSCFYIISLVSEVDSSRSEFLSNFNLLWILQFQLNAYKSEVVWNEHICMCFIAYKIIQWIHLEFG